MSQKTRSIMVALILVLSWAVSGMPAGPRTNQAIKKPSANLINPPLAPLSGEPRSDHPQDLVQPVER